MNRELFTAACAALLLLAACAAMQHDAMQHDMTQHAPESNAEHDAAQPAATLRQDDFDAPAPAAVAEAQKAGGGGGHEGRDSSAAIYTCPMHPQVTSTTPGVCSICGMTLVKKE